MRTSLFFIVATCLLISNFAVAQNVAKPALGINLAGPSDWNTELPFADAFRLSRAWISQKKGEGWGKGPDLELDDAGWVKRLSRDCFAETPLCTIDGGHYPSGLWTITWEGSGKIELSKGKVVVNKPNRLEANIDSNGGGFFLRLLETDPNNPVRNIQALLPGITAEQVAANPWRKNFLDRWKGVTCLRFMDFQDTNNSTQAKWSDRPLPNDATFTRKGVPIELLCDLANRLECDAWFCVPHLADDDYVRQFANLVKQRLDPKRKAYIEYSNEVWNGQFRQHHYAAQEGQKAKLAEKPWEAAWFYTSKRSIEIFKIWEAAFGDRRRLVRVIPSQAANKYIAQQLLGWQNAGQQADVLAIAPYISLNIPASGAELNADKVASWTVEQLLDYVEEHSLPECMKWIEENKKVADQYGLKLVCYEAGQHFVGVAGGENNEQLTKLLHAANSYSRMKQLYSKYYAGWEKAGGDLLCHFSSTGQWSKWGSWGLLQFADEDARNSPKFTATIEWANTLGQPIAKPK